MLVLVRKVLLDIALQTSKQKRTEELMELRNPLLILLVLVLTKFDSLLQRGWLWESASRCNRTSTPYLRATPQTP